MKKTQIYRSSKNKSRLGLFSALTLAALLLGSCTTLMSEANGNDGDVQAREPAATDDTATMVYRAELTSINEDVSGLSVSGTATITLRGDSMFIEVVASGLEPGMMHMQHYHGFTDGQEAECATMDEDVNGDEIVDLIETRAVSGVTLVPFNENPAELELTDQSYPTASEQGTITYSDTVVVSELLSSLSEKYGIDSLQLENRVVYLHGVSEDISLPETVESLPDVAPHMTLPIACGRLEEVDDSWLPF